MPERNVLDAVFQSGLESMQLQFDRSLTPDTIRPEWQRAGQIQQAQEWFPLQSPGQAESIDEKKEFASTGDSAIPVTLCLRT
jgi:hypothetical protein